jgi:hypothetical protein
LIFVKISDIEHAVTQSTVQSVLSSSSSEGSGGSSGILSAFTSYLSSYAADDPPEPSDEELDNTLCTVRNWRNIKFGREFGIKWRDERVDEQVTQDADDVLLSAFTSYLSSYAADDPPEPSDEELDNTLCTVDCVKYQVRT